MRLAFFINYAMTTSVKSLIKRRLLNWYSYAFALKVKHLYRYVHNDLNHVLLYICVRILIGSTIRRLKVKFIPAFLFRKWTKRSYIYLIYYVFVCTVISCITLSELTNDITFRSFLLKEYLSLGYMKKNAGIYRFIVSTHVDAQWFNKHIY